MKTLTTAKAMVAMILGACALVPLAAQADLLPAGLQGEWVAATASATTYWNRDNGAFLGGGSGTGQMYKFSGDGTFQYALLMDVRTGMFHSRAGNDYKGTVTFKGDTFTLHITSGHFGSERNGKMVYRPMPQADQERLSQTYHYSLEKGGDGKPRFYVVFGDGSKSEFRPNAK